MPAKGKHRRPKTPRFSRSLAAAGTGGAALALPLVGATGAHAATPAQSVSEAAVRSLPETAGKTAAQPEAGVRTYTVRGGDCLARIAEEQHVSGGWQRLYDDNRQAIGADPALIHPGLKLSLGTQAAPARTESATPKPARPAAPKPAQPAGSGTAQTASAGYTLPVAGATIGTGYHVAGSMWSSGYHTGVDFVVPTGTPLKAVAAGTVVSAGWGGAYGNQVVLKLNDGHYAQYAHLSQLSVSAGQTVTAGRQVGLSGATGNVTGPHLHFEIRTTPDYGSDVDPVAYLRAHGVPVG
ncbi:M23 family metallopeptidase [Streptomyces cyanogenus]|uniref:Glycyl-glycine endopeptidase ALE-1 n=1 Tax=Streptomyces cyanogenus TaxID=80860 RepID=A0ABX7TZS0_STRCY|nr:LysM peptidoglycan-binding domain-containing M23 family metallopeptidase [Streptomyces cyanogenus]QTE02266.1 Glycyl-glycine endopeptidase ALE-1 precursor [Streptomyces cyanogenus]